MKHNQARAQVDRLFTGGLSPQRHSHLRDHLRECDSCRHYYEGVRGVEDTMFANAPLNDAAVARMADLAIRPAAPKRRRGSLALLSAVATATAALLVVALVPTEPTEDLRARGVANLGGVGLSVFHIDRATHSVRRVVRQTGGAVLPVGAVVQLGVTTNGEVAHLAVLGVDERGRVHWYQEPTSVPANVVDEVIGGAWQLGEPGVLRLFAVFNEQPIDRAALDTAAAAVRQQELAGVLRLPDVAGRQDSVLLEVRR